MTIPIRLYASLALLIGLIGISANGQPDRLKISNTKKVDHSAIWTSEQVFRQLARQPNDPYLQYVAIQLARREGQINNIFNQPSLFGRRRFEMGRGEQVNLFNTFTGALAVQESLQLDTLVGDLEGMPPGRFGMPVPAATKPPTIEMKGVEKPMVKPADKRFEEPQVVPKGRRSHRDIRKVIDPQRIAIESLTGPTIKSHPWESMLAGRKPDVGTLSKCVPEDFYLAEFKSVQALTQALSTADVWGDHLITQMMGQANSQDTERRIKKQLGIAGIPAAVLDAVGVETVGVTGSDLFLADGSDVTLLVQGKQVVALRQWADGILPRGGEVKRENGKFLNFDFVHSFTPDLELNVYTADPRPNLHLRSNSLPALQRVLAAIVGQDNDGKRVARLGDSLEFAYIRTILPRGAAEEDGLIYLSDPCIRRLVGPVVKLGQRRRLLAFNHLKMIEHAALMFRTENGRAPRSFEELAETGCAPGIFGKDKLACPAGGTYTLAADGMSGENSVYGQSGRLKPLIEVPISTIDQREAIGYQQFLEEYNAYWRTFFDPIAVRIKVTPEQYRLETVILPLIDNSIYTALSQMLGGKPVAMDLAAPSKKTILTVAAKLNKKPLLDMLPADKDEVKEPEKDSADRWIGRSVQNLRMIALAMHNHESLYMHLPPAAIRSKDGKPLLSWRVALLPLLEQENLFQRFKLDEPWDSAHNKQLIKQLPQIYRGRNSQLTAEGKTTFLVPVGKNTMYPPDGKKVRMADIKDGLSTTIAFVEATDDKAVIWTKPDDWEVDLAKPHTGLTGPGRDGFVVAMGDGSVQYLRSTIPAATLTGMLTRNGGEHYDLRPEHQLRIPGMHRDFFDMTGVEDLIDVRKLRRFLKHGIGDYVAFHMHDAAQPINVAVTGAFGVAGGEFMQEIGGRFGLTEMMMIGLVGSAFTNPVCISIPVNDAKAVDEFLVEFDRLYVDRIKGEMSWMIFPELYRLALKNQEFRCLAIKFFGVSFRICWGRVGNQLYIVNHPSALDDLTGSTTSATSANGSTGHAWLRVRPENWKAVLPTYQLGWEEGHRNACTANANRLTNVASGWKDLEMPELIRKTTQLYGVRPFCPDGGQYSLNSKKECTCSLHSGWSNPRQSSTPSESSATAKTIRSFGGMTASLTFLEDGLHAVVTIDRK